MKRFFITSLLILLFSSIYSQGKSSELALTLYDEFSKTSKVTLFKFEDPLRHQWRRTPGKRHGIALYEMTSQQKILIHEMLSNVLTSSGYGKVGHVLFNEDLSEDFDPNTGQNKYWFALYGKPSKESLWGWRLEGHHLSINFTFKGDELVSSTPFVLGSFPAEIKKDTVRAGFRTLSKEIDHGIQLIQSMTDSQQEQVVISDEKPSGRLAAESNNISVKKPIGIKYSN